MKNLFKKHIGALIMIIILLVFPTSLSNQARLNMRIIVTGIAVDKVDDKYEVTAQIAKITPGKDAPGTNATIDFISDSDETLAGAVSKLSYKAGKAAAFSHTNFIILGKDLLKEDVTKSLDYFIRDKFIKNSALLLFAEENAKDEMKKTKNIELSVGLGLQKVYLYKEKDGDGVMSTVLDFLNRTKNFSKTATASVFSLKTNEESSASNENSNSSSSGSSTSGGGESSMSGGLESPSSGSSGSGSGSGGSGSGSSGGGSGSGGSGSGSSGSSSGGSGGEPETQFFTPRTPVMCFVDGKFAGKLEEDEEILGYMLFRKKTNSIDLNVEQSEGKHAGTKFSINIRDKSTKSKVRFENGKPCLDITFFINNADINEILTSDIVPELDEEDFQYLLKSTEKTISKAIATCFEKGKSIGADVFDAYEQAYKFLYNETQSHYSDSVDFVKDLKLNVSVEIKKLDY